MARGGLGDRTPRRWLGLAGWLGLSFVAAAVGAAATAGAPEFYLGLDRPSWAPPPDVFGPVWTVLYVSIGVAAWLVWERRSRTEVRPALALFVAQLVANALWSWIFFRWRLGLLAFLEILLLLGLIVGTGVSFWKIRRSAGLLLVPYLLWVCYAAALSLSIWQRNAERLG